MTTEAEFANPYRGQQALRPLPDNTRELLLALRAEFYGGPLAHADAFRILPRVVDALEAAGAIKPGTGVGGAEPETGTAGSTTD